MTIIKQQTIITTIVVLPPTIYAILVFKRAEGLVCVGTALMTQVMSTVVDGKNVGLTIVDDKNVGLTIVDDKNVGLTIADDKNVGLTIVDNKNVGLTIVDDKNVGLTIVDDKNVGVSLVCSVKDVVNSVTLSVVVTMKGL